MGTNQTLVNGFSSRKKSFFIGPINSFKEFKVILCEHIRALSIFKSIQAHFSRSGLKLYYPQNPQGLLQ